MKTIRVIDRSLRETTALKDGALSFREKLEIARYLDRLKPDAIELSPLSGSKADILFNKTVAQMVSSALEAPVTADEGQLEAVWESVRGARHPRLNVEAPVSPVQMEYSAHKKAPALLQAVENQVKACRALTEDVCFTALDATRAESDFLCQVIAAAVRAGARRVTLCDSAGTLLPDEFGRFVADTIRDANVSADVEWYVQVSDLMHMGLSSVAAALRNGACGVCCAALPGETTGMTQVADLVRLRGTDLDMDIALRVTELARTVEQLKKLTAPKQETAQAGFAARDEDAGIILSADDPISEVIKAVGRLGYDLTEEDNARVFEAFRRVAEKKSFVGSRELDAIVASTAMQVPSAYKIESYVINSGNIINATANITLLKDGARLRGVSMGDGPIDAAFLAIEQIIGHHYELDDFQIQAVTEGREAMGSALVKLRADGKLFSGNGISTDIIGASIRAYLSALNKIVYEEASV